MSYKSLPKAFEVAGVSTADLFAINIGLGLTVSQFIKIVIFLTRKTNKIRVGLRQMEILNISRILFLDIKPAVTYF